MNSERKLRFSQGYKNNSTSIIDAIDAIFLLYILYILILLFHRSKPKEPRKKETPDFDNWKIIGYT